MIRKTLLVATLIAVPTLVSGKAEAREYCREYTKTITVGGRRAEGYGTACRQPDGDWEIVSLSGDNRARNQVREEIYDDLQHKYGSRRNKVVVVERSYYPRYQSAFRWPIYFNFGNDHHHYKPRSHKRVYKYVTHHKKHHKSHGKGHSKHHDKKHDKGHKKGRH